MMVWLLAGLVLLIPVPVFSSEDAGNSDLVATVVLTPAIIP